MSESSAFSQTPRTYRKTKIVATLGPSSWDPNTIEKLINAGVNVFRLNFSHGTHEEHTKTLGHIRAASERLKRPVAVLQDLSGPKIRISKVEEEDALINDEQQVDIIAADGQQATAACIRVEAINPADIVESGHRILLADGIIELQVKSVQGGIVRCQAVRGGRLRSRVGIAFPDGEVRLPAATDKDIEDLSWGIKHAVDIVAMSFVQEASDVERIREILEREGSQIRILAKIEHKAALRNIEEILKATDAIMVARGDLGLEVPVETLPILQRDLVTRAQRRGIPVVIATQMLHSMVKAIRPTRAEVTDVAVAVMEGADAVMLSEETAIGDHPVEAVRYLGKIAEATEGHFNLEEYRLRQGRVEEGSVPDAVAYSACAAAQKINATALVACTDTGNSPRLIAKYRPPQPVFGATSIRTTLNQLSLVWGVYPVYAEEHTTRQDEVEQSLKAVQKSEGFANGSKVIVTSGLLTSSSDTSSVIEVKELNYG